MIEALKDAFMQGRLTRDELGARVGQTLAARAYADLDALTADLPPGTGTGVGLGGRGHLAMRTVAVAW